MFCRGAFHSGTCAVAVASLLCGLHVSSPHLHAQTTATGGPGATFNERFSPGPKSEPVFTRAEVQDLFASLPPPADAGESTAWVNGGPSPILELSLAELWGPAKILDDSLTRPDETLISEAEIKQAAPPPAPEGGANAPAATSLAETQTAEPPSAASTASVPMQEPELPPPPSPAEVVLSLEPVTGIPGAGVSKPEREPETVKPPQPKRAPGRSSSEARARQNPARTTEQQATPAGGRGRASKAAPQTTGSIAQCPAGANCLSQPQPVAILFGFIIGGLLGGPIGALAIGTVAALMTTPDEPRGTGSNPAQRR